MLRFSIVPTSLLIVSAVLQAGVIAQNGTNCNLANHHDCNGGAQKCIPLEWVCDNVADCENGSDELKCSYVHTCGSGYMMCHGGECIARVYKCDGETDCSDGSDEKHCEEVVHNLDWVAPAPEDHQCLSPKMRCSTGQCLTSDLVCDGNEDCLNGEDEKGCRPKVAVCKEDQSMCSTADICIPKRWVCDGTPDCIDGSDESDCNSDEPEIYISSKSSVVKCSSEDHFHCATAAPDAEAVCIPLNSTCNSVKDCPLGDDESSLCADCSRRACQHSCLNTPKGAKCVCQPGWKLDVNGVSCIDEDECLAHGHLCQQYCEDSRGTYNCKCAPGYVLGHDGHSCRLDRSHEGLLFLSLGSEIRHMPLADASTSNEGYTTIQRIGGHGTVRSMDFMNSNEKLFMAISALNGQDGELAVSEHGLLRVLRENVSGVGYVAVDWMGGNVFFTQKAPAKNIGITTCTINGFFCRWIIRGQVQDSSDASRRQNYRGLAVHPLRGSIIYIDTFKSKSKIMMANMDGSNIRPLVDNKLEYPSGLSIDMIRNDVYFGDFERKMIERVNIDTRDRRVVLSQGVSHPYDLIFFNGFLYWSDWGSENLKYTELNEHHSSPHVIHSFNRFPYGISINHTMYQPSPSVNPCDLLECSWICVVVPDVEASLVAQCICPDNYEAAENDCVPLAAENVTETSYIGTALMKEYCLDGVGCWNGGTCKDVVNEHGRTERIVCECELPYEGEHCERLNPEMLSAVESSSSSAVLLFIIFLLIAGLFVLACFVFYKQNLGFKTSADGALFSAQEMARELAQRTGNVAHPFFTGIKKIVSPGPNRPTHVVSSSALAGNVLIDPEPGQGGLMSSPSSYHNPLYTEVPTGSSPIAGVTDVVYRDRFNL